LKLPVNIPAVTLSGGSFAIQPNNSKIAMGLGPLEPCGRNLYYIIPLHVLFTQPDMERIWRNSRDHILKRMSLKHKG
jgi:hypothetical protein